MKLLKNYTFQLLLVSGIALVLSFLLTQVRSRYFDCPHFYWITIFFATTTYLADLVLKKGDRQSREFIMKIMALSMGRLLLCMVLVFIYSMVNKPQALGFACHFMLQYLLFTIFELSYLLKFIKQPNNTHHP